MRNFLFFCLIAGTSTSCSEDFFSQTIEIDPPLYTKQMVAHTLASNLDSTFTLPLTRNFGILDQIPDTAWAVKNAVVEIYEDGQLKVVVPPAFTGSGQWYTVPLAPGFFQPGRTYELRASHPDFPTVSAKQVMPGSFQIDSTAYRAKAGISAEGDELAAVDVYLKDPAGVKNYYVITAAGLYTNQFIPIYDSLGTVIGFDTTGTYLYDLYPDSPEDPNVHLAAGNTFAVSDQFFDGQAYKFSFRTYRDNYPKHRVYVRSVTEDYYLYILSALRKSDADDLPLVEPVTVHHNLEQGLGIFGLGWEEVRDVQ